MLAFIKFSNSDLDLNRNSWACTRSFDTMAPPKIAAAPKGQKSLFSFFKKAPAAVSPPTTDTKSSEKAPASKEEKVDNASNEHGIMVSHLTLSLS